MVMPIPVPVPLPLDDRLCNALATYTDDGVAPLYRMVPLFNRVVVLRRDGLLALSLLPGDAQANHLRGILRRTDDMEHSFTLWKQSLPGYWPRPDHLFELYSLNKLRETGIFLEDLRQRCWRQLSVVASSHPNGSSGQDHDIGIGKAQYDSSTRKTQSLVDAICASIPLSFEPDNPSSRAPHVAKAILPSSDVNYFSYRLFS